jgi:transcription termination factor NusB
MRISNDSDVEDDLDLIQSPSINLFNELNNYSINNIITFCDILDTLPNLLFLNRKWSYYVQQIMSLYRSTLKSELMAIVPNLVVCYDKEQNLLCYCDMSNEEKVLEDRELTANVMNNDFSNNMSDIDEEIDYEVEDILSKRTIKKPNNETVTQYLLKWSGYKLTESTWEARENLNCDDLFSNFEHKYQSDKKRRKTIDKTRRKKMIEHGQIANESQDETYIELLSRFGEKIMQSLRTFDKNLYKTLTESEVFSIDQIEGDAIRFVLMEHIHRIAKYADKYKKDIQEFDGQITHARFHFSNLADNDSLVDRICQEKPARFSHLFEREMRQEMTYQLFCYNEHCNRNKSSKEDSVHEQNNEKLKQEFERFTKFCRGEQSN